MDHRPPRSALVFDGGSGPSLVTVRSLGRAGWRVVTQARTRSAASRFSARAVPLANANEDGGAFLARVDAALASESFDVVVPAIDALGVAARETLTFDPIAGGTSVWKHTVEPDDVGVREAVDLLRSVGFRGPR